MAFKELKVILIINGAMASAAHYTWLSSYNKKSEE
jgi:hypothetical protein